MLTQVADGVLVHESKFLQSNSVIVQGRDGVLLIDPGITRAELAALAADLRGLDQLVVAGFSTHPHWDHVLWHPDFGDAPRYGTARGAATIETILANPEWRGLVAARLPSEYADDIPMELFGLITALPTGAVQVPWAGPTVRILEHQAHTPGHASLVIGERGTLVAGDLLSDILIPFIDARAADPVADYLDALRMLNLESATVDVVIPGHGSVGGAGQLAARIALDRAYLEALRAGTESDDPRLAPAAPRAWLADVHQGQVQNVAARG